MHTSMLAKGALGLALLGTALFAVNPLSSGDRLERGKYLVSIMDCAGCHTPGMLVGKPDFAKALSGSDVGFHIPELGYFYPPNLTPDPETGLGRWSEEDIVKAVRTGERPDGRVLAPVMPYHAYGHLSDQDAYAMAAYLKSLKPIRNEVPALTGASDKPQAPYLTVVMPK